MRADHDPLTEVVIGDGIRVHRTLGCGLLESAYEDCLALALRGRGLEVRQQVLLPVEFEGHRIPAAYRIDLLVEGKLIVEIKCVSRILPVHEAQLRTYLRLSRVKVGLLMNFHVSLLRDGIRRFTM
ncbi:MAG: GxxExxY protein [Gemmatimonadaceae bacterium]|nr:GxxExxY protein [Gemmatimonadaceae bacterium]NUQ93997.1 GxxExxY protein [Gemmatimonadaceae bacterium]NUR17981.1 GxxExxY protein [Gemmatimonadaceae bacterium]NUS96123.1 GxxExxY protein [Gemmatimonadaceae bacterium]